jgi:hypothetical protein
MTFAEKVREAAEGTPYVVTDTDDGFDVTLDVVDAQWYGVFNRAGLHKVWTWQVKVEGDTYSITDASRTVEWVAGTPRVAGSIEVFRGRAIEFGTEKIWAFDEHGRFGRVADYRFDSREGRDLVEGIGSQLGLEQKRGTAERLGLVFGVIGAAGAVITVIVLIVAWLAGAF